MGTCDPSVHDLRAIVRWAKGRVHRHTRTGRDPCDGITPEHLEHTLDALEASLNEFLEFYGDGDEPNPATSAAGRAA